MAVTPKAVWDHRDDHPMGNPGSVEAGKRGCLCPVMDNGHGRLDHIMRKCRGFVVRMDCPVHVHRDQGDPMMPSHSFVSTPWSTDEERDYAVQVYARAAVARAREAVEYAELMLDRRRVALAEAQAHLKKTEIDLSRGTD